METQWIQGAPCPLCGQSDFSLENYPTNPPEQLDYACLWEDETDPLHPQLHPRECACCGNIQLLLTRT